MKGFIPDFNNILDAAMNKPAKRLPLYEHNISVDMMERLTKKKFEHLFTEKKYDEFFKHYCNFFPQFGYDTVTFEACVTAILPHGGALAHPQPGYIDGREKLDGYPFNKLLNLYRNHFSPMFEALSKNMPKGMKAIGGVGNGIFECAQDLAGYENLCIMSFDEPDTYSDLFKRIGDQFEIIWDWFLTNYKDVTCVCRMGDDLGYKSNTLLPTDDIVTHVIPQYKRVIDLVHKANKPFLLHSCGCIFGVMDELIAAGIDAKHSNEDAICEYKRWVDDYGAKIGNFGGIDTDHLCRMDNKELEKLVANVYNLGRAKKGGFALGSGNSIPAYVDAEKYLIMINTVRRLRGDF